MSNNHIEQHEQIDENEIIQTRRSKLSKLREQGVAYPSGLSRDDLAADILEKFNERSDEQLATLAQRLTVAGRIMLRRMMGKASFTHLQDSSGRIQLYVRNDSIEAEQYEAFKSWDLGDIIWATGILFKTRTGELSIKVDRIELLSKSIRPLPDKYHGLNDKETCYRQRYLDLMVNESTRKVFQIRSQLIAAIRQFMIDKNFLEVETPMMQAIPGGAVARPFVTHHNALDMELYLRIAPELYLKRLLVGGFERVFEINRNFRNEGLSTQHNPEFTMLEFYQAYADHHDLIELTEEMLRTISQQVLGTTEVTYQGKTYDFAKPFHRMTVKEAILHYSPEIKPEQLEDLSEARKLCEHLSIEVRDTYGLGKLQIEIFEKVAEHRLDEPTFITEYPTEVSPLARRNDDNPFITDRFEFFIAGREIANGFSELNDPDDQAERFHAQVKEKDGGDLEAMHFDQDYITALEYGMPPAAGEGIGIDRLAMLFTDAPSIRDVLLFPHMRSK